MHDGGDQKNQQKVIGKITAWGQSVGHHLAPADVHRGGPNHSHQRRGGQCTHHVIEKPAHPSRKNMLFALFRMIPLDDANPAERFRQASCDFGIDLAAFAKNGTNRRESFVQCERKTAQRAHRNERERRTDAKQKGERNASRVGQLSSARAARRNALATRLAVCAGNLVRLPD